MKHHYAFTTLRKLVAATCLRRTKALTVGTLRLAAKTELEEVLDFNQRDRALHEFFKSRALSLASNKSDTPISQIIAPKTGNMLILTGILRLICNHGENLLSPAALMAWRESDPASVDWKMISVATRRCESCSADMEDILNSEPVTKEFSCGHSICADCKSIEERDSLFPDQSICIRCTQSGHRSPNYALASPQREKPPSAKVNALIRNLREEQAIVPSNTANKPTKSVVFTYWTKMLDLIQNTLEANAMVFERIDGRTTLSRRIQALDRFNSDPDCRIMLATIGSVGEGVNLTVASFVHIMEPQWNPMTEAQAVDRVHRIGQTRDVIIRRYTIRKSIESYVKWVQDHKLKLIQQSLSESETSQSAVDEKRWKVLLKSLGGDGLA